MNILHGPVGNLVRGHVLDVSLKPFQRALRDYDPQLYTIWNPRKLKGWGCWEIRRLPNRQAAVYQGSHQGVSFYKLLFIEFDTVHHVLDAAFLNYDAIRKIKEMDTWGNKNWVSDLEVREEAHREATRTRAREELRYAIKQNRNAARDFYEAVRSGIHPAQVLLSTKWGS